MLQAEHADSLNCLQVCSSVAGGTGSGLGTRVTEALRDEHGKTKLVNLVRGRLRETEGVRLTGAECKEANHQWRSLHCSLSGHSPAGK